MLNNHDTVMHGQETDYEIVSLLLPYIKNNSFIDIGAEKGSFASFLISNGLTGSFFEPLPKHAEILTRIANQYHCHFLPYAISNTDGDAKFYLAYDHQGNLLDYFHSLHLLTNDNGLNHKKSMPVICRSLNSLYHESIINRDIGIIKTDTEGNDLNVLMGATDLNIDILVCEFFTPGIYSGWEQGDPVALIDAAKLLGFNHFIAIKRMMNYEFVSLDSIAFIDKQWGNLIFIKDEIFKLANDQLNELLESKEFSLSLSVIKAAEAYENEINLLREACEERLNLINLLDQELKNKNTRKTRWARLLSQLT